MNKHEKQDLEMSIRRWVYLKHKLGQYDFKQDDTGNTNYHMMMAPLVTYIGGLKDKKTYDNYIKRLNEEIMQLQKDLFNLNPSKFAIYEKLLGVLNYEVDLHE